MIYEFALEPELVAKWHDRKEYLFFDEKFGLNTGRMLSAYPKKWKKLVWKAFRSEFGSDDQNAEMRLSALLDMLWENSVKRKSTFPDVPKWLERAEKEHDERPFRAIIATRNPREHPHVLRSDDLVREGHALWDIPDDPVIPRSAEDIANAAAPILRLCRHAVFADPHFDPNRERFRKPLEAMRVPVAL